MARDTRENSGFRHEDQIDDLFDAAYPNPHRLGCPQKDTLRAAARKELPIDHAAYDHLSQCSECYKEFRTHQQGAARSTWVRSAIAAAAVFAVVAIGGIYAVRTLNVGPWSSGTESVLLDYRNESVTRSEAGEPERPTRTLPRKKLNLMILLPIGSESGSYELRLVGSTGQVVLHRSMIGQMENFALRVRTNLDLRSLSRGSYLLEIRRAGEDWDPHPVLIR
jgi:hypothetical protein